MREAVVVDAVRTPVGKYGGVLKDVRSDDLAALCISEIAKRNNLDPNKVEDVIFGCSNQAGDDNRNVGRMALLLAGFPVEVGGQTGEGFGLVLGKMLERNLRQSLLISHGSPSIFFTHPISAV